MALMQFWGIEVKGKEPSKVKLGKGHIIHLSQATFGELKKDGEPVTLYVKVDNKKLVLGILSKEKDPQLSFDLMFEKDFEISHNWKNGSVHLLGYQSGEKGAGGGFSDVAEDVEEVRLPVKQNGEAAAPATAKAVAAKPSKDNKLKPLAKPEEDDDSDDDEDDDSDDESDEDMLDTSDDSDDEEDSEDDEEESSEEETPAKVEIGKKQKAEAKTPEHKKAKAAVTPQKTDGKKSGHTDTPYPSKKGGKAAGGNKSIPNGGQLSCGSRKKTFNSNVAQKSHTKVKHSGK